MIRITLQFQAEIMKEKKEKKKNRKKPTNRAIIVLLPTVNQLSRILSRALPNVTCLDLLWFQL